VDWYLYILALDHQIDLATATVQELESHVPVQFGLPATSRLHLRWEGYYQRHWKYLVWAFRSLVKRLYGLKTLSPGRMRPQWADLVLRHAVSCLSPEIGPPHPVGKPGQYFSRKTFPVIQWGFPEALPVYLHQMPYWWIERAARHGRRGVDEHMVLALDRFWIQTFVSLLIPEFVPPVCDKCGMVLPPTPTGKRPRRERCVPCEDRERYAKQKADPKGHLALKKKWSKAQKKQQEKKRPR
jgi:hypothetical protein